MKPDGVALYCGDIHAGRLGSYDVSRIVLRQRDYLVITNRKNVLQGKRFRLSRKQFPPHFSKRSPRQFHHPNPQPLHLERVLRSPNLQ